MRLEPALATLENFFLTRNSSVSIGQNYFNNSGPGVYHEFSCITVGGNYEKLNSGEFFENSCLTSGGDFITSGNNIVIPFDGGFDFIQSKGLLVVESNFHIESNFVNNGLMDDLANVTLGTILTANSTKELAEYGKYICLNFFLLYRIFIFKLQIQIVLPLFDHSIIF